MGVGVLPLILIAREVTQIMEVKLCRIMFITVCLSHYSVARCEEASSSVTRARELLVAAQETLSRVESLSCRSHLTINDSKSLGTQHQFHNFEGTKYRVESEDPTQHGSSSRIYAFDGREYRYFEERGIAGSRVGFGVKNPLTQIPSGPWQWSLKGFLSIAIGSGPPYALKEPAIWDHWSALVVDAQPERIGELDCLRMEVHIPNGSVGHHWLAEDYNGFIVKSVGYNPEGTLVTWTITDKYDVIQIAGRDFLFPTRVLHSVSPGGKIDTANSDELIVDAGYRINDPDPNVSYTIDSSQAEILYNMDSGIMDYVAARKRVDTKTMVVSDLIDGLPVDQESSKLIQHSSWKPWFLWLNGLLFFGFITWGIRKWLGPVPRDS